MQRQLIRTTLFGFATMASLAIACVPGRAVTPDEMLQDPALEARARVLSQELRCVVCQNQSIDDSNAPLARDLRVLLRERLKSGDGDREAVDFIVARYGNFVLLKPPMQLNTILLWVGPLLILLLAGLGFRRFIGRSADSGEQADTPSRLTDKELEQINAILNERSHR
ncbi:MAG: cytochrome c-type biogenesis protein CcmH [Bradyrhizobium sp.]|nr:cytochrome c-type biogenesis protein CcmH [Bradyrhizobium sp.]